MSSEGFLHGKRIVVTRAKEQAAAFSRKIEELNGVPMEIPLITIQESSNVENIKSTLKELFSYDWIVLTSINGVEVFFRYLRQFNIELTESNRPRIAVVGKKTLHALEKEGLTADLVPMDYVAESLFEELQKVVKKNESILLARGNLARPFLVERLQQMGVQTTDLVIYETVINEEQREVLLDLIRTHSIDIITFTSSSTVTYFNKLLEGTNWRDYLNNLIFACIGPITEQTARELAIPQHIVADDYTIDGLLTAIVKYIQEGER